MTLSNRMDYDRKTGIVLNVSCYPERSEEFIKMNKMFRTAQHDIFDFLDCSIPNPLAE